MLQVFAFSPVLIPNTEVKLGSGDDPEPKLAILAWYGAGTHGESEVPY
jgi:hypothetical protein